MTAMKENDKASLENSPTVAPDTCASPKTFNQEHARTAILHVAAALLEQDPFPSVRFEDVVTNAGVPDSHVRGLFRDMHEIGTAILDHERASMHSVQQRSSLLASNPLEQLAGAFRMVGENLAKDLIVRAGVRIAAESRHYFPERRLDPFQTWQGFVSAHLARARHQGLIRTEVDLPALTWIVVAAGMGTKDALAFQDAWPQAANRMEATVRNIISLISAVNADGFEHSQETP